MAPVGPVLLLDERLSDESVRRIAAVTQHYLDEIISLRAEVEALRLDAERYRFVRTADGIRISTKAARDPVVYDAAVDAARAAQGGKT